MVLPREILLYGMAVLCLPMQGGRGGPTPLHPLEVDVVGTPSKRSAQIGAPALRCTNARFNRAPGAPQAILEFGEYVYNDKDNQDDAVTKSLVALLGDLASNVTGVGPVFAQKAYVQHIIQARVRLSSCL